MSLDGFIADNDDSLDFLSTVEREGEDYGYANFVKTTDTVIIGRKTYDKVLSMGIEYPHSDKTVYIISRSEKPSQGTSSYYTGNIKDLIGKLKSKEGKNIYCDGGAEIANLLMKDNLIDEYIISIIPTLLGSGIRLFNAERPHVTLKLIDSKQFESGLIQVHYAVL